MDDKTKQKIRNMQVKPESMKKVLSYFRSKDKGQGCWFCGNHDFIVNAEIFTVPLGQVGGFIMPSPSIPFIMASCKNCGHSFFFLTSSIGITEEDLIKPEEK